MESVMATQREIVQKAFDQVNLALLEQQMTFHSFAENTKENLRQLAQEFLTTDAEIDAIKKRLDQLENPPAA